MSVYVEMTKQNAKKNTFKSCVEADPPNTQGTGSKKQDSIGKKKKKKKNKRSHKIVEVGSKKWMEQLIEEKVQEHAAAEAGAKKELTAPENSNNEVTGICHMCQQPWVNVNLSYFIFLEEC